MRNKEFLIAFGLFLGLTLLFFYPFVLRGHLPFPGDLLVGHYAPWKTYSFQGFPPGGVPHKAQGIDVVRELFPWKHFSIEILKQGELPFWNPYNFSGNPHLANFQTGVFYPLNLLFFLFPFNFAWSLFILLQPLLACFFTYLFAREIKISRLGSFFASLAFAFCLYFTVWIEYGNIGHTLLWLPLALFLVEKIVKESKLKWNLFLIGVLTLSFLAGYIQALIYLYGTVLLFFFFRFLTEKKAPKQRKRKVIFFLGTAIFPFFLAAFQLLPTLEIFFQSARGVYPTEKIPELLLPWFYSLTTFASDFFGNPASRNYWYPGTYIERVSYLGVLPLFFGLLALLWRRQEKIILFFTGLALFSLLFTLNLPPIRFFYGLKIPIISTTVYTRLLSLFSFSLAILAGLGIDYWLKEKRKKPFFLFLIFFGAVYLFLWLFTFLAPLFLPSDHFWYTNVIVSQRNLILPSFFFSAGAMILILACRFPKRILFWGIFFITLFDLFFYFHKITPFSPPEFVYPQTEVTSYLQEKAGINRFWGYGTAYIDTNFSTFDHTFSPEGNDPLLIHRYGELMASASNQGMIPQEVPRADVVLEKGYGPEALRENPYRQRIMNLLGVKYLLHKNDNLGEEWLPDQTTFPKETYSLIWQKGIWQIYENQTALPRFFLVGDYQVETDNQKIMSLLFDPDFNLEEKVILEKEIPDFVLDNQAPAQVELINYHPNQVKTKTLTGGNKILFLSDNYFPGWRAFIDGEEKEIYRANYSFRAVTIPPGEHEIIFTYQPQSFKYGLIISIFSLLGLCFLGYQIYQKKR